MQRINAESGANITVSAPSTLILCYLGQSVVWGHKICYYTWLQILQFLAEHHNHIRKKKPMYWFSHGDHGQRYCLWARPHDGDDYNDGNSGVAQHGGHTPNNGLTETCSLGLLCTYLILDIHVMINWHLSKQGIHWPVSRDHIAGSSLQLIEVKCFFKLTADQVLVFRLDRGLVSG